MPKITLEAARVNTGLTQVELAEKMGVSRESVVAWENGKRDMKAAHLFKFCQITGFDYNDISLPKVSTLSVPEEDK